jgi:SHS family lactate transporter-like MFS transporter
MSKEEVSKNEVEYAENVDRVVDLKEDEPPKKKNIFVRMKDSIYQKPERPENIWKLLTMLNHTQRITFAAGKAYNMKKRVGCYAN